MRRPLLAVVLLLPVCGGDDSTPVASTTATGDSSTADASTGTACTPGESMDCICHQGGTTGTMTCLADGSGYGPCGGACACPPGRSDGCCAGDGICCTCVVGCDPDTAFDQDPETDALIACACAADVCAEACSSECAGNGIGSACGPCVEQAGMDACMAEWLACQPP